MSATIIGVDFARSHDTGCTVFCQRGPDGEILVAASFPGDYLNELAYLARRGVVDPPMAFRLDQLPVKRGGIWRANGRGGDILRYRENRWKKKP